MADISQITIPNGTTYNLRDASAAADMSLNGNILTLKNRANETIRSVTLPSGGGGGGASMWLVKNGRNAVQWTTGTGMVIRETEIDSVTFTGTATGYHWAYYPVDLTNYSKIVICCDVSATSSNKINGFAVWEQGATLGTASNISNGIRKWNTESKGGAVVWDVSDLSGVYWVGVAATYTDKVYVTAFYLE